MELLAEPLRARLTALTDHAGTPVLDHAEWSQRIARSDFVEIYPTFFCSDDRGQRVDMELQLLAILAHKSFNVSYNPRLNSDCQAEAARALVGPWDPARLYVYLGPDGRTPPGLACTSFPDGKWCLGAARN